MNTDISEIEKRMIEATAIVPLIKEMAQRIGWEEALNILREVNQQEAFQKGQNKAIELGSNGIDD